ncbi:hypothetical protein L1987_69012 [Smallanthus sonchifolius]|uniref:Uncharacterized protein n=1 Tax=Smallanthus sonchifolius TaxID=185202 RepID=A0ACB9B672_9ASTR|nr:hypothetical protein L1987_69012 [Smallanthus sonchifolius]
MLEDADPMYYKSCNQILDMDPDVAYTLYIVGNKRKQRLIFRTLEFEDHEDADPMYYKSCKQIWDIVPDIADTLYLIFVDEIKKISTNRKEYIELLIQHRYMTRVAKKVTNFAKGFADIVEDWKRHTICDGYMEIRRFKEDPLMLWSYVLIEKNIVVNSTNRKEYIELLIQHRYMTRVAKKVANFAKGFADIVGNKRKQRLIFRKFEFEVHVDMLHGIEDLISVEDWKRHTIYDGYTEKHRFKEVCPFVFIVFVEK